MKQATWLFLLLLLVSGCKKQVHGTRNFYMAVTPWPHDFTKDGVNQAYDFIANHCDAVSHHFDDGIPWQEAWDGTAWPAELEKRLNERADKTPAGKKVLLSVAALTFSRHEKAGYFQGKNAQDKGVDWLAKPFDDSMVVAAYCNFITRLADKLHADFINFGVESNSKDWDSTKLKAYRIFLTEVYKKLKAGRPGTPMFISVMVQEEDGFRNNAKYLSGIGDWTGLSFYPYSSIGSTTLGNTDPALINPKLMDDYTGMANRPWCFAETGYIAQDLHLPQTGISKRGTPEWQEKYLNMILDKARNSDCKLLVWFCHRDYDAGARTMAALGAWSEFFGLWQDTGFEDENGYKRLSWKLWDNWYRRSKI